MSALPNGSLPLPDGSDFKVPAQSLLELKEHQRLAKRRYKKRKQQLEVASRDLKGVKDEIVKLTVLMIQAQKELQNVMDQLEVYRLENTIDLTGV